MRIIITLFALLFSITTYSQIDGGTMIAGGGASFNTNIPKQGETSSTLSLTPQFGLAFADNFVAGAWFQFQSASSFRGMSIAPFLRYYMNNFFLQAGYGYSYNKVGDFSSSGSIVDLEFGYAAFLNDNVALEPALYYNANFFDGYTGSDLGIKLGFQIYFNR